MKKFFVFILILSMIAMAKMSGAQTFAQTSLGIINITDPLYAADPTGAIDSSAAVTAAFTAAAGRIVYFPTGTYKTTSATAISGSHGWLQTGAKVTGGTLTNVDWYYEVAQSSPTAGSLAAVQKLDQFGTYTPVSLGAWWSANVEFYKAVSRTFTSSDTTSAGSPMFAFGAYAANNGNVGDVTGALLMGNAFSNNAHIFGANIIAGSASALTGIGLCGLEIDMEPYPGSTIASGSLGLKIAALNVANIGPAISLTGDGGTGTFGDGIQFHPGLIGNMLASQPSLSCNSFIDAHAGTYSTAAIIVGNGLNGGLFLLNPSSTTTGGYIYQDSSSNLDLGVSSTGLVVFQNALHMSAGTGGGIQALSSGTATVTVAAGCRAICTDTTALQPVKCSVSGTTLTITGTGSDSINWFCF